MRGDVDAACLGIDDNFATLGSQNQKYPLSSDEDLEALFSRTRARAAEGVAVPSSAFAEQIGFWFNHLGSGRRGV